jgi:hypothetical protein
MAIKGRNQEVVSVLVSLAIASRVVLLVLYLCLKHVCRDSYPDSPGSGVEPAIVVTPEIAPRTSACFGM